MKASADVYILGGSQTDFARNWAREGHDLFDMFAETLREAALAFAASQESWIEIRDGQNRVLWSRLLRGGESGPAAVPGKPSESLLISAINYDGLEMPPDDKRLSAAEIARLTEWVERGLPWPEATAQELVRAQSLAEDRQIAELKQNRLGPEGKEEVLAELFKEMKRRQAGSSPTDG